MNDKEGVIKVDQKIRRDERFPLGLNGNKNTLITINCRCAFNSKDRRELQNNVRCEGPFHPEASEGG